MTVLLFSAVSTGEKALSEPASSLVTPQFLQQAGSAGYSGLAVGLPGQTGAPPVLQIVPILSLSERYDSNVFFAPKIPGLKSDDYVTTASPQLFIRSNGKAVDITTQFGATSEYYVNNPGLGYVGYNASARLNFTSAVARLVPGATFQITESILYTPIPPAFVNSNVEVNQIVGPASVSDLPYSEVYIRGLQASRINTTGSTTGVLGSVPVSPRVSLAASYYYSFISFGTSYVAQQSSVYQPTFFGSRTHTVTAGPSFRLSARDSLNLNYVYSHSVYDADQGNFSTQGGTIGWGRIISPEFVSRVYAGATAIQTEGPSRINSFSGANGQVAYTGGASLNWTHGFSTVSLGYSTGVYPSYFEGVGPQLGNYITLSGTNRLSDRLFLSGSINWGKSQTIGGQGAVVGGDFETVSGSIAVGYRFYPWMLLSGTQSYAYYKGAFGFASNSPGAIGDSDYTRSVTMLTLTMYYL